MKSIENILSRIPITKILNFFSYYKSEGNANYNTYSNLKRKDKYLLFNDDSDSIQVFSISKYSKLTKAEVFLNVSNCGNAEEAFRYCLELENFSAIDNNSNLSQNISVNRLLILFANLIEPDSHENPIFEIPQFQRKIFLTSEGCFKTPMFFYNIEQTSTNRIVNFVEWNESKVSYLNSQTFCFNATHFNKDLNKFLLVTCNPNDWIRIPTLIFSPDYFQILAHPHSNFEFFNLLVSIYKRYELSQFVLHISTDEIVNNFFSRFLSYLLNYYSKNFFFDLMYSNSEYHLKIISSDVRENNIELAKLFGEMNFNLRQIFLEGQEGELEIDETIENLFSTRGKKMVNNGKVISFEVISGNPKIAVHYFNLLLKKMRQTNLLVINI